MTMLEDALRRTLAARVQSPPPTHDLADRVIRRARRVRRRRTAVSGLAGVLAMTLAGLGAWSLRPDPVPPQPHTLAAPVFPVTPDTPLHRAMAARATASPKPFPIDVIMGDQVETTDGQRVTLPVRQVSQVYRVPTGWLALSADKAAQTAWLVRADGRSFQVADDITPGGLAVDPSGVRLAWQSGPGSPVHTAQLTIDGKTDERVTPFTSTTILLGWVGQYVVLGDGNKQHVVNRVDVWDPTEPYHPTWIDGVSSVIGLATDGVQLVGRLAGSDGDQICLVLLDPSGRDVTPHDKRCVNGVMGTSTLTLSPDGRWLVAHSDVHNVVVLPMDTPEPDPTATLPCDWNCRPVWADETTLLVPQRGGVLRFRVSGARDTVSVPGGGDEITLVPRLGD